MKLRISGPTWDEIQNSLDGMARSSEDDPSHEWGRAALAAVKETGHVYSSKRAAVFETDDPGAIKALVIACESVINTDGYDNTEALAFAARKRSCRRILRTIAPNHRWALPTPPSVRARAQIGGAP